MQARFVEPFALQDKPSIKQLTQIKQSHCESLYLPCTLYKQLWELAKNHQVSLFHLLLGVLAVYFARTAQKDAVVIGLPVQADMFCICTL
jgi:hypothetical protein